MREYPMKPLDLAVWWTEHVIEYGGNHLRAPAANMSTMEYYEVKLVIIIFIILIAFFSLFCWLLTFSLKLVSYICKTNIKIKIH